MKTKLSPKDIINLHIESDKIIDVASMSGDYKTNNKEFKKRNKLFKILEEDLDMAKEVYEQLLAHDCITTKISAASECLKLGIYTSKAEQILEEISKREDIGIRRFNAEMVLKVWRGEFPGKTL